MLKYIVAGTGRCGTVFMARFLTDLGIPCGHESVFNYDSQEIILKKLVNPALRTMSICSEYDLKENRALGKWIDGQTVIADSSYLSVPYLQLEDIKNIPVIHIVRNPFDVIRSYLYDFHYFEHPVPRPHAHNKLGWENRIYDFLPELANLRFSIERAVYFYIKWNEAIEKTKEDRPYYFSQIENINQPELYEFLGVPFKEQVYSNTKINSAKKDQETKKSFTLNHLPKSKIKEQFMDVIDRYKYVLPKML